MRFEDVPEWDWRTYVSATGLRILPNDLREHLVAIERMPGAARVAWISEQVLSMQPGRSHSMNDAARRKAERAMARGADTAVGQILADHDARHSATLQFWLSQAIVFASE